MFEKKEKKKVTQDVKIWHPQQEQLLRDWAEISSGYRWLHDTAYRKYKKQSLNFTIPVIIMSTVTGTANFAQESFPVSWQHFVPMVIGFVNLVAAIITTISQFLKINELMEGNRVASISFGKLARNVTVELNLPHNERTSVGAEFLRTCQAEFDRLIEQSPPIPKDTLCAYKSEFSSGTFAKPELLGIKNVNIFKDTSARTSVIIADAADKLHTKRRESEIRMQHEKIEKEIEMNSQKEQHKPWSPPSFGGITLRPILKKSPSFKENPLNELDQPIPEITPQEPVAESPTEENIKSLVDQIIEKAVDEVKEEERPKDVKSLKSLFDVDAEEKV